MLEVNALNAAYGRAQVLYNVDLHLDAGEVAVLLGRNGAGKSTTLKAIMALLRPLSGAVRFEGQRIDGLEPYEIARRGLGYVPEDRRIFTGLTVAENLEVGRQPPRPGAPQWTPEKIYALFPNLAGMQHRIAASISGGEQQMLSVARTLVGNPKAILLDEPSEGLAPLIVEQMANTILELRRAGVTLLLCEQNLAFARRVADRAFILEKGEVRYSGTMARLDEDRRIRDAYLSL